MAARTDDVRNVSTQIAAELVGARVAGLKALEMPSVILASNLASSETARIPRGAALGFVTAEGSRTSHVSIIARWTGIPAVVGVGDALQALLEAETVAVDGGEGYVVANPNPATMAVLELTKYACEAVQRAGIWVEVCGEAAGDPALIPKLVELGFGELSMSAL